MADFLARVLGWSGCLLVPLTVLPVHADPFFLTVYGRTYKVDPRYLSDEPKGPKPQEAMKALPSDIARGPGFRPSHEQVLAEVEERLWIARNQLIGGKEKLAGAGNWVKLATDAKQEVTGSLGSEAQQTRSPELRTLSDRYTALTLLARELRHSMDFPVRPSEETFSRPKLPLGIEANYRDLEFDPLAAYYSFRRVKAAFRSGDVELLSRVAHYPVHITGTARRTIRNPDELIAAKGRVMDPHIREVVAKSTFETVFVRDKGMMLGEGEVWITHDKKGFGLGAVDLK